MKIKFVLSHPDAKQPTRAHDTDAGNDLYALEDTILVGSSVTKVKTGVSIALPVDTVGIIKDRSSMGAKGMHVFAGVIDTGYVGNISVVLYNSTPFNYEVKKGDRIGQLVIMPIVSAEWEQVDSLEITPRQNGGFGSSGK